MNGDSVDDEFNSIFANVFMIIHLHSKIFQMKAFKRSLHNTTTVYINKTSCGLYIQKTENLHVNLAVYLFTPSQHP